MSDEIEEKMVIIEWSIGIGFPGAIRRGEWEVSDDISDDELDQMLQDEIANYVDANWRRAD
jgi:hypothetical protein